MSPLQSATFGRAFRRCTLKTRAAPPTSRFRTTDCDRARALCFVLDCASAAHALAPGYCDAHRLRQPLAAGMPHVPAPLLRTTTSRRSAQRAVAPEVCTAPGAEGATVPAASGRDGRYAEWTELANPMRNSMWFMSKLGMGGGWGRQPWIG